MFSRYTVRPDTTYAVKVTADNAHTIADWLTTHVAPAQIRQGHNNNRYIKFTGPDDRRPTRVPIPGYLQTDVDRDGRTYYQGDTIAGFTADWQPADD